MNKIKFYEETIKDWVEATENYDYPEAETMETRRCKDKLIAWQAAFWTLAIMVIAFMFFGNWFISTII